jgi:phage head maturation protease
MAVDNESWDGPAAMSAATQSDDPAAAYRAICAGRRDGDPAVQSTWALPHHREPGMGPNADGVRNSLSRLPQTEGLTNADAAESHLQAHMDEIHAAAGQQSLEHEHELAEPVPAMHRTLEVDEPLVTLSVSERRLGLRLLTYNEVVKSKYGPIMFEPGAFGQVDPKSVRLRMDHEDPPTGLGLSYSETPDAPLMDFRVSKTDRGNDQLTLAVDGVSRGVSVGFDDVPGGPQFRKLGGQRVLVYPASSARLAEVSTTWTPTFAQPQAGVMYVLSKDEKGEGQMAETQEAPAVGTVDTAPFGEIVRRELAGQDEKRNEKLDRVLSAFDEWKEERRSQFTVPGAPAQRKPELRHWVEMALRQMRGQTLSPTLLKELALDDVVIADNPGLVPDVLTPDYDDVINSDRPFCQSTRKVEAPVTGTSLILPIITQRAVAGTQSEEKGDVTTTATQVGTGTFTYQPVFGGADISIQMLNRAERSFFDILTGDMGEAYALDCDTKAITALLDGYTDSAGASHDPNDGGVMDPVAPGFGVAWENSITNSRRAPDTIWMSAAAVAAFIDAVSPITNAPLYSNLAAAFTAGAGPGGTLSGLRPVYVPALNGSGADVVVGPARGFVWAEDAARNLQVDVPSKAGRDIALVGGIFPAPRYADSFTIWVITS